MLSFDKLRRLQLLSEYGEKDKQYESKLEIENKNIKNTVKISENMVKKAEEQELQGGHNTEEREKIRKEKVEKILDKRVNFTGFTRKDLATLNDENILKYDKRTFCQYFSDLLLYEHPLLGLFFYKSLMNPLMLRINHLFFSLSLNFAFNAIFYSDEYIQENASKSLNKQDVSIY